MNWKIERLKHLVREIDKNEERFSKFPGSYMSYRDMEEYIESLKQEVFAILREL